MNWTQTEHPIAPWDTPDLPPRTMSERCARHTHCAYRDDDPARCAVCHRKTPPQCRHTTHTPNVGLTRTHRAKNTIAGYGQCGKCGDEWTGFNACHCPTCHRTFTGITAFDLHRTGSHAENTRRCLDPLAVGLIPVTKKHWSGWGWPGADPRRGK